MRYEIESKSAISDIRTEGVEWSLSFPRSFRRSLVHYFRPHIIDAVFLLPTEEHKRPDRIKDLDPIDEFAEALCDEVIERLQDHARAASKGAAPGTAAAEVVQAALPSVVMTVEQERLKNLEESWLELTAIAHSAFDVPIEIE